MCIDITQPNAPKAASYSWQIKRGNSFISLQKSFNFYIYFDREKQLKSFSIASVSNISK